MAGVPRGTGPYLRPPRPSPGVGSQERKRRVSGVSVKGRSKHHKGPRAKGLDPGRRGLWGSSSPESGCGRKGGVDVGERAGGPVGGGPA